MPRPDSLLVRHDRPRNSYRLDFRQPSPPLAAVPLSPDRENGTSRISAPAPSSSAGPFGGNASRRSSGRCAAMAAIRSIISAMLVRKSEAITSAPALPCSPPPPWPPATMTPGKLRLSGAGPVSTAKRTTGTSPPLQRPHRIDRFQAATTYIRSRSTRSAAAPGRGSEQCSDDGLTSLHFARTARPAVVLVRKEYPTPLCSYYTAGRVVRTGPLKRLIAAYTERQSALATKYTHPGKG
jgi:hypothetical protein